MFPDSVWEPAFPTPPHPPCSPRHSHPALAKPQTRRSRDSSGTPQATGWGDRGGPGPAPRARAPGSCLFTGKRNLPSEITKSWEGQEGFGGPSPGRWVGRGGDKGPGAPGPEITRGPAASGICGRRGVVLNISGETELSPKPRLPSLFRNTAAEPSLCLGGSSRKAGILWQCSL